MKVDRGFQPRFLLTPENGLTVLKIAYELRHVLKMDDSSVPLTTLILRSDIEFSYHKSNGQHVQRVSGRLEPNRPRLCPVRPTQARPGHHSRMSGERRLGDDGEVEFFFNLHAARPEIETDLEGTKW